MSGELDLATAPQLEAALQRPPEAAARIVLDLTRLVHRFDRPARPAPQAHGRGLTILPSDIVTRAIRLTGLDQRLLDDNGDPSRMSSGASR